MDVQMERKDKIVGFMKEDTYRPMKLEELSVVLDVPVEDREQFEKVLAELEQEGAIYKTNKDRYGLPERLNLMVGRMQGNERGFGFLIPDDEKAVDIFIPADGMAGAMNNDRVIARITSKVSGSKRAEGEIIKILKRAVAKVVGTFENSNNFGFVVPDDRRIPGDVFIPKDEINGAKPGFKVIAEIVKWPEKRRNAEGKIVEIIGDSNQVGIDIVSVIKSYGFKETFPEEVINQAESIPEKVSESMIQGRRDIRDLRMVTIDGEDAKDLDDAVSIEMLPDGIYRLGVHIADVSSYVTEGSPLDQEALERGTSVYLVDRVIPMLPAKLSNGVCSLNPHVDRLAFSVMMDLDSNGQVIRHEIFESVIRTNERMTYTNVYKLLESEDVELENRYAYLMEDFRLMKELALILRQRRMDRGAIDFDFDEAKIILDDKGKPIEVRKYEITIANKIIEEFMLVCNETVAEHFHWVGTPFVYRIHEEPDSDRIMTFAEFSKNLGYPLKGLNKIHPKALQDILKKVKGSKEETIVSTVMLRSLAKARYSQENAGHFGLAAEFYCHFTSPIRRYPDLIIHRLIKEELNGKMTEEREEELMRVLPEIARTCSERERAADEAERETDDLKKVEFMKDKVGEVFLGMISNVTSFGMFVELENTIEGLVKVSSMEDDYYVFDDKHFSLIGERTKKVYSIGDEIRVLLARADIATRQLDFVIVGKKRMEGQKEAGESDKGNEKYLKKNSTYKYGKSDDRRSPKRSERTSEKRSDKKYGRKADKFTGKKPDNSFGKRTDKKPDNSFGKRTDKEPDKGSDKMPDRLSENKFDKKSTEAAEQTPNRRGMKKRKQRGVVIPTATNKKPQKLQNMKKPKVPKSLVDKK